MAETVSQTTTAAVPEFLEPKATGYSWYVLSVLVVVYSFNFIDRQIMSILAEIALPDLLWDCFSLRSKPQ